MNDRGHPSPAPTASAAQWRLGAALVLIAVAAMVGYLNADHDEFYFDSDNIRTLADERPGVVPAARALAAQGLHPGQQLTWLTFALNYWVNERLGLDGLNVTGFLVTNVLVHACNACLVFLLLRALMRASGARAPIWPAVAAALWFAVHPIHASSVVYIIQRRGALATTFYLLGVLAYLRARRPSAEEAQRWSRGRILAAVAVAICYWLSVHSKTLGLTLPAALIVTELALRAPDARAFRRAIPVAATVAALFVVGVFGLLAARGAFDWRTMRILPLGDTPWGPWTHFLTESRVFVQYWKVLLLPLPRWSCVDHSFELSRHLFERGAVLAILLHAALLAAALPLARRRFTLTAIGIWWFYVALIPYVCLPQIELYVEYKTYLPSVGLAMIIADLLGHLGARVRPVVQAPVVALACALLLATTLRRNAIYHDATALWSDVIAKSPTKPRGHYNLGHAYLHRGDYVQALHHCGDAVRLASGHVGSNLCAGYALIQLGRPEESLPFLRRAVARDPENGEAHYDLGIAYLRLDRTDEAIAALRRAVALDPDYAAAHGNLGDALLRIGQYDAAILHFRRAVLLRPEDATAHTNLAAGLFAANRLREAYDAARRAVALDPTLADAQRNLGHILEAMNEPAKAERAYRAAIAARPADTDARYALGNLLARAGRAEDAIEQYQAVLAAEPDHFGARVNLASALAVVGRPADAIIHFRRALQTHPDNADVHCNLAMALEELGRPDEAAAQYRRALEIDPAHAQAQRGLKALLERRRPAPVEPGPRP
jgi:tetratricopeptide (TPR) repeat protein